MYRVSYDPKNVDTWPLGPLMLSQTPQRPLVPVLPPTMATVQLGQTEERKRVAIFFALGIFLGFGMGAYAAMEYF
jgi:hypothetical protein